MKRYLSHVRDRVLAGLIFLIPLFAILLLLKKLWTVLTGAGSHMVQTFGLKLVLGNRSVPIATAFLLVLLFYFFGWLVKFNVLNKIRDWIETSLLQYIPGYLTYKAQLQDKINPKADYRTPVWVITDIGKRPGLLIEDREEEVIAFLPNSPDSNNGVVLLVPKQQIVKLDMNAATLMKSLQQFGKDLPQASLKSIPQNA